MDFCLVLISSAGALALYQGAAVYSAAERERYLLTSLLAAILFVAGFQHLGGYTFRQLRMRGIVRLVIARWAHTGQLARHVHRVDLVTDRRPKLAVLLALGIAGGVLPDPSALALLLAALSSGKVLLGLTTVMVFSVGFAMTLVVVGIAAAMVGQRVLDWLSSIWAMRLQIATTLLILAMGVVLTAKAASQMAALPA